MAGNHVGFLVNCLILIRTSDVNECLQSQPRVCDHKCIDKPIGYSCECNKGFEINPNDSRLCQDVNECEKEFPCSQLCTNTHGAYKCSCVDGYVTHDGGHTCKANSFCLLIYSSGSHLSRMC
ncbi:EGF-containing fibulin-like extracellular matrix protein 2 [Armadillidium nasatum]|uniref:EGF-containing fibulin-like extracellular matrix protein 2 n=1 Tax=Armadillidium nasatum TaxID=96803 RepID=A0A5N5THV8_9CRUS|nr:EGF-containing fibulin-like extracellular matrix protein 2 [Armadillidium nasatum]